MHTSRLLLISTLFMIALLIAGCTVDRPGTIHIDTQQMFDSLRNATFQPGDRILFKKGSIFRGQFAPKGSGTAEKPIYLGTYGEGARPQIHALGKYKAAIWLRNQEYWEINGLEITNTDGSDQDQGELFGIYVLINENEGTYNHIHINNNYIHDVNGAVAGKRRGGIHIHIKELDSTKIHDLRITKNRIRRIGGVGIGNTSSCGDIEFLEDSTINHNLWTDVYVADNVVDSTGRNNIIARVSKDAIYERNVLANSSRYSTGHSIFCFDTEGIKIQYNEAYGNVGGGGMDRGGFDADYNCVNTYIQYNYSHDNLWFCGIMKRRNRNVVIRYNISQNDRQGIYFYGFDDATEAENIHIYNNTHYVSEGLDVEVFPEERTPLNTLFENNIFYFEGEGKWGPHAEGINTVFRNNLYFNISPHDSETQAIEDHPGLSNPGSAGTGINLFTMKALGGYRLHNNSPAIDVGVSINNNGGQDILKQPVDDDKVDVGAVEYQ